MANHGVGDVGEGSVANVARLPFIHRHVAVMPDVHWGRGVTLGARKGLQAVG